MTEKASFLLPDIDRIDDHVVGHLAEKLQGTGVRKVAEHGGITLWAEVFDGRPVDCRAFDRHGKEVTVFLVYKPEPQNLPPTDGMVLRPMPETAEGGTLLGGTSEGMTERARDGGTPKPRPRPKPCPYVCPAGMDGGGCFQVCD